MDIAVIDAPFGQLRLIADRDTLIGIEFLLEQVPAKKPASPWLKGAEAQLHAYFKNAHHQFSLPMRLDGTSFQLKVWQALWSR